ncbi:hypothetical protein CYMTET_8619 [Cymbomonas tetramitiformis]|uniref:m7GpppX diphosphatase n=1 Tax=Cymbomonas tetramitiformis TaxID=36881 RepID=A0AAE0C8Z9_9CHLO|nr:hypothetical protein CYMTET_40510 [Cymbomonas tetramitiformis]KAK3283692.1 hypothetical protein CYMTET_8619 [Cymbomonas tetramitiformis]
METLKDFVFERVIGEDQRLKSVAVLGRFEGKDGQAVVLLSRRHFAADSLREILSLKTSISEIFSNDVYSKYEGQLPPQHAAINVDLIYPATAKHISKHSTQNYFMLQESPRDYMTITRPFIQAIDKKRIQWVYNILDKSKEVDRLLFEDPDTKNGFMLHPDLKWDQQQAESLYCIAICHSREVQSMRDITPTNISMLKNIRDKSCAEIAKRYGVPASKLRVFIHYQPSYYHFHVHFCHVNLEGMGAVAGRAHLLSDVIDNVENIAEDYYSRRTLTMVLGENDPLVGAFIEAKGMDWLQEGHSMCHTMPVM